MRMYLCMYVTMASKTENMNRKDKKSVNACEKVSKEVGMDKHFIFLNCFMNFRIYKDRKNKDTNPV